MDFDLFLSDLDMFCQHYKIDILQKNYPYLKSMILFMFKNICECGRAVKNPNVFVI